MADSEVRVQLSLGSSHSSRAHPWLWFMAASLPWAAWRSREQGQCRATGLPVRQPLSAVCCKATHLYFPFLCPWWPWLWAGWSSWQSHEEGSLPGTAAGCWGRGRTWKDLTLEMKFSVWRGTLTSVRTRDPNRLPRAQRSIWKSVAGGTGPQAGGQATCLWPPLCSSL